MYPLVQRIEDKDEKNKIYKSFLRLNSRDENLAEPRRFDPVFSGNSNKFPKTPRLSEPLNALSLSFQYEEKPEVFKYRRKTSILPQIAPFTKYAVPDLVILNICHFLSTVDICNMMRACQRFYDLGSQAKNWRALDLAEKRISEYTLAAVMRRNVQYLRLSDAKGDPLCMLPDNMLRNAHSITSRMKYLDTSRASLSIRSLGILLKPCTELTCLSLEGQTLDETILFHISLNPNLKKLDLSMSTGITKRGVFYISRNCRKLTELNVSWCGITKRVATVFCELLTSELKKLNISGTDKNTGLTNSDIEVLVKSCPNLEDLDVSDNIELTNDAMICISKNLHKLTTLSCNRCYGFDPNIYIQLNNSQLKFLNVHGCIMEDSIEQFRFHCDKLEINRHIFNYTAKPISSTSPSHRIWDKKLNS